MKYALLSIFIFAILNSCKEKNNLVEVAIPEPEIEIAQPQYSEPKSFKSKGKFQLAEIPYAFDDLDNFIDGKTMELHYSKYYLNYTNKLNNIVSEKKIEDLPINQVLNFANDINSDLKNNAGEYYNHTVFFESLSSNKNTKPTEELITAFINNFGSFESFKQQFIKEANTQFGSGWTWLIINSKGKLQITNTDNHNNPLMFATKVKGKPLLCLDLWEHAYYLKYHNNRKKYINTFFEVVNWNIVSEKYSKIAQN